MHETMCMTIKSQNDHIQTAKDWTGDFYSLKRQLLNDKHHSFKPQYQHLVLPSLKDIKDPMLQITVWWDPRRSSSLTQGLYPSVLHSFLRIP